jgi:dihydrofolate reductase
MKPNHGREPSPVTTFDANALRLAESSSLCVFADECCGSARRTERRERALCEIEHCGAGLLEEVSMLRGRPGGDIYVYGSLSVVRALLTAGLVHDLVLMIEPITPGGGKTLFPDDGEAREFELMSARTARTGVQVCRYQRAS